MQLIDMHGLPFGLGHIWTKMLATFSAASRCSEARNASNYDGLTLARTGFDLSEKVALGGFGPG